MHKMPKKVFWHLPKSSIGPRTVQILEDQILARPIFYFLQHPEAPDLKKRLITGTRSEIESLKKNETWYKHYIKPCDDCDCHMVFYRFKLEEGGGGHYSELRLEKSALARHPTENFPQTFKTGYRIYFWVDIRSKPDLTILNKPNTRIEIHPLWKSKTWTGLVWQTYLRH